MNESKRFIRFAWLKAQLLAAGKTAVPPPGSRRRALLKATAAMAARVAGSELNASDTSNDVSGTDGTSRPVGASASGNLPSSPKN